MFFFFFTSSPGLSLCSSKQKHWIWFKETTRLNRLKSKAFLISKHINCECDNWILISADTKLKNLMANKNLPFISFFSSWYILYFCREKKLNRRIMIHFLTIVDKKNSINCSAVTVSFLVKVLARLEGYHVVGRYSIYGPLKNSDIHQQYFFPQ